MLCGKHPSLTLAVAAILASSQVARAQDQSATVPGGLEEIVVTAQKREQSLQEVPLSVAAFTGEMLDRAGVDSILEVSRLVPNLSVVRGNQVSNLRLSIRGVGTSGNTAVDPSIGLFVDGIYVPRPGSVVASFNDMAGVEVLRGPQGTLFGRNATVGGIIFRTADPTPELGGNVELQAGDYGMQKYTGVINLPAGDRLAFRLAGLYDSYDGYGKNRFDGKDFGSRDTTAGRLGMKWDITDALSWTLETDYSKIGGDGAVEAELDPKTLLPKDRTILTGFTGGNPPDFDHPFDHKSNQRIYGDLDDTNWGVSSDLSWSLAGDYTLRFLAGYREWQDEQLDGDVVFLANDLLGRVGSYDSKSQSYELQLVSPKDELLGGRLDYVAGLYYFQEDFFIGENVNFGSQLCNTFLPPAVRPQCLALPQVDAAISTFDQDAESFAAYAQADIGLTDTLDLVLGARWTQDDKSGRYVQTTPNPYVTAIRFRSAEDTALAHDDEEFNYRVGLNWKPNDDLLVFTSYSTGYKSGGFNSGAGFRPATLPPIDREFAKETSDNLELGVKSTLANGRARLNATAFLMNLEDFQDKAFDGTSFNVTNAGNLRNQGVEVEGDVSITDGFRVFGALGYLDAEFTKYPNASCLPYPSQLNPNCTQNLKGETPTFAPELQGSLGAQLAGDFGASIGYLLRADLSYQDEVSLNTQNDGNPQGIEPSYTLLSARFSLMFGADRNYTLSVFGDNLTDEGYCTARFAQVLDSSLGLRDPVSGGTVMRCIVAPPRTYGLSLKVAF